MSVPERKKKNAFALRSIPAKPGASTLTKFYCNVCEEYCSKRHVGFENQLELDLDDKRLKAIYYFGELSIRIPEEANYDYAIAR